mgnify:CR=1 FL=1
MSLYVNPGKKTVVKMISGEVIPKIETQGACAFEVEDEITELMKKGGCYFCTSVSG